MANTLPIILFPIALVLCISAAMAARTKISIVSSLSQDGNFSICKSLVETQGYTCQEHNVTTPDGYILGLQRILVANKTANNPPVLIQHGLLTDAQSWMLGSPNESLAFMLADNRFDVWLSNTRGTPSSLGHTSLTPHDFSYWEWSWDELAAYDLPTFIQYVHDQTGQKLHYIGHSLGTLTALAAFSEGKLLNMLRSTVLLSPISYLGQMPSPVPRTISELYLSEKLYRLGVRQFIPGGQDVAKLVEFACNRLGISCTNLLTILTGPNCCVKKSVLNAFLERGPQPTAMKNIMHLAQMVRTKTIAKYGYGNEDENMKHYGQATPPIYNMTNIPKNFPLFLSYGGKDTLSDVNDNQVLLDNLKVHDRDKMVVQYLANYAHVDFVLGTNANQNVFEPLIAFLRLH
ncbi:hypothetical protein FEM48_Zijuj04G0098000 [Ziziphus jujuba var. spinosa]|uniref:Lipase n=1 Tax=Ziziphus jujuba var. spinosa TaxID=714518 RepID=A0A978VJ63_ZIZJJ|nr:hypothetical protein FEM48_Zijuj04G0098000 [Ziziphus jujuba var. spinosa]